MAKLEAVIDANIKPFQAALKNATASAEEFGGKMAGVGSDLLKNLSGIDIEKALGIGVAIYAAQKLGDALVGAARKGLESFEAYERAVLRLKYTLPGAGTPAAGARAEEIAQTAGAKSGLYSAEQMRTAALYLAEASKELRESPAALSEMLDTMKALALKTGQAPEEIAEAYRRLIVGIKEEGGMAVAKFFRSTPGMEAEVEKLRDAHSEAYLHAQGLGDASQASAAQAAVYHHLQTQSISDFMSEETSRKGATAVLEEIKGILERSAPKGIIKEAEAMEPGAMLAKAIGGMQKAFGEQLKPAIDDFTKMIIANMPAIKDALKDLGTNLALALEGVTPMLQAFGNALSDFMHGPVWSMLGGKVLDDAKAISDHVDQVLRQKAEERGIYEESAKAAKEALAANTGIFAAGYGAAGAETTSFPTKESVKSAEEVAKISARADAAHEESQRRINFEQAQSELRASAIAASRSAAFSRPVGATEALDKQYAAEAEATAKIINIKAAAAEKTNAAEEEAANRIAKINEEQSLRNIDRVTANAMDEGAEKQAILARLNAQDDAAQLARNDIHAEAAEKIRAADIDAANQIIDAQEASAEKIIDAQKTAALKTEDERYSKDLDNLRKRQDLAEPSKWETWSRFGKGGVVIEGSADKKAREERLKNEEENARREHEIRRLAIDKEYTEKKLAAEDALERQRPTLIGLKRTHEIQQEESVKAIDAEKRRTEADQEFIGAHEDLKLTAPKGPDKDKPKADISIRVVAEILTKIWDSINIGNSEFEKVFMADGG